MPARYPEAALSGASAPGARRLAAILEDFQRFTGDPYADVCALIEEEPAFVMAHAARADMLLLGTDPGPRAGVRAGLAAIEALPATPAERRHLAAVRQLAHGEWRAAARTFEDISIADPGDLLALQAGQLIDLLIGDARMLRDRILRALPAWPGGRPGRHAVLGMLAFGLEETGDYARAEAAGLEALALDRRNSWAWHAVAHVHEMQGRVDDGVALLAGDPDAWARDNFFAVHNWWHLALFRLERGEAGEVLGLYDAPIRGAGSTLCFDLVDASALLWRLDLAGADVGDRWRPLADAWAGLGEETRFSFNDAHAMMAFAGAGRFDDAAALLDRLRTAAARPLSPGEDHPAVAARIGLPVCEALLAFAQGRFADAADRLRGVRNIAHGFGGSHAQRDLIDVTAIEAALRGGETALARALAAERLDRRPASRTARELAARAGLAA
jgi:tetratricopeptide (TPR) repeat protein